MDTQLDEIADGIYRISTFLPGALPPHGLTVNQFLVTADEPLLFHTGMRAMFPAVIAALTRVMPVQQLRWISFGHVEADECGAMNLFLAVAPDAQVVFGELGCQLSLDDMADRPPRPLASIASLDLGGRSVSAVPTPHVPHNWEAQVLFEATTRTLLCGDLFSQFGRGPALTSGDVVAPALDAESRMPAGPPGPAVPATLRRLAQLEPRTLAAMHGSSFHGDAARALRDLADGWAQRFPNPSEDPNSTRRQQS